MGTPSYAHPELRQFQMQGHSFPWWWQLTSRFPPSFSYSLNVDEAGAPATIVPAWGPPQAPAQRLVLEQHVSKVALH